MTSAGKVLQNRYSVQKQIGEGGMGTVYVATDERFGSTVAIKETLFADPNLRRAFEREAQLLNSLRHPVLPRVSDHFTEGNGAFIVMEYIAGEDLSAMVERDGAFAVADVLRWANDLLDALDYLHNQKLPVIHRDIKPQNLKLTPRGEIILLDFGLAKGSASELSQISITKSVFGYSRSYAPLEQIQGAGTDPRSDLYGLAATLYHLLTGKPPIDALTRATAVLNGNADPLPSSHTLVSKIPVTVSNVFHQAMALNANLRPATAARMKFALTEAANNLSATKEFYDGTTILSGGVSSSEVFTRNTQLIDASANETKKSKAETLTDVIAADLTDPQPAFQTTRREQIVNPDQSFSAPMQRHGSALMPIGIAAALLLFGGGGFAAWYASNSTNSSVPANQTQKPNVVPEIKSEVSEANSTNSNAIVDAKFKVQNNQAVSVDKSAIEPVCS